MLSTGMFIHGSRRFRLARLLAASIALLAAGSIVTTDSAEAGTVVPSRLNASVYSCRASVVNGVVTHLGVNLPHTTSQYTFREHPGGSEVQLELLSFVWRQRADGSWYWKHMYTSPRIFGTTLSDGRLAPVYYSRYVNMWFNWGDANNDAYGWNSALQPVWSGHNRVAVRVTQRAGTRILYSSYGWASGGESSAYSCRY